MIRSIMQITLTRLDHVIAIFIRPENGICLDVVLLMFFPVLDLTDVMLKAIFAWPLRVYSKSTRFLSHSKSLLFVIMSKVARQLKIMFIKTSLRWIAKCQWIA